MSQFHGRQFLIVGGRFFNTTNNNSHPVAGSHDGLDMLMGHCALGAMHDSEDRSNAPKCDPDTRSSVIKEILTWATGTESSSPMLWVHGSLGVGKSALAQSVAELCCELGCLAGSFFFSRKATDNRWDGRLVIPTLVYQLVLSIPDTRPLVKKVIKQYPSIFTRTLEIQMRRLFIEPLNKVAENLFKKIFNRPRPKLIVVDGLDECSDREVQFTLLKILTDCLQSLRFPLRVLITSRPEVHITQRFTHYLPVSPYVKNFNLSEDSCTESDIRTFLRKEFSEIKRTHPFTSYIPESWPNDQDIEDLIRCSSAQFIYASTVIKYIRSDRHQPVERLKVILGLSDCPINDTPYAELDALYTEMLSSVEHTEPVLKVLGILLIPRVKGDNFGDYSSPASLERLLSLRTGEVVHFLVALVSVLIIPSDSPDIPIRILHGSLAGYLFDRSRSGRFHCDRRLSHSLLASGFMKCVLPSNYAPSDQENDPYCCSYWDSIMAHLSEANHTKELQHDFSKLIRAFPESQFYFQQQKHLSHNDKVAILDYSWSWAISLFRVVKTNMNKSLQDFFREFDKYHEQHVIHSDTHDELANVLTLLVLCGQSLRVFDEDSLKIEALLLMLPRPESESSSRAQRYHHRRMYLELLCDFLRDPNRSGQYTVSGAKFAKAALACLKPICGPRDRSDPTTFLSPAERPASWQLAEGQRTADLVFITLSTAVLQKATATKELSLFVTRMGVYNTLVEPFRKEVNELISVMKGFVE
ncbi:hypothetical protein BYT27DRAFT_7234545 [Phlegmacium glaucopus]|nr:hypothetical protein BYT27DRAFT_7234545 [Phlegmacium glaucopus]